MNRVIKPIAVAATAGTVLLAACAKSTTPSSTPTASASPTASATGVVTDSKAANLRTTVNLLLAEHLSLAVKTVDAALGGRTAEFSAYGDLLNTNGTDIGGLIGQVYGADAQKSFNGIWSAHNADFVEYTQGPGGQGHRQAERRGHQADDGLRAAVLGPDRGGDRPPHGDGDQPDS